MTTARMRLIIATIALAMGGFFVAEGWTQGDRLPLRHPQEEGDLSQCSACHETESEEFPYRRFEHTPLFGENHRLTALGSQRVCEMCHRPSFCADCHGAGAGLKPSLKNHGETRRRMPHRGDYLTRHRIEGRLR